MAIIFKNSLIHSLGTGGLVMAMGLSACSKKEDVRAGIDPAPEVRASQFATNSFKILSEKKGADLSLDRAHLVILKSALNKEFLLSSNVLSQTPTPMFQGLQSRVVYFIERDGKVFMLEASKGHSTGDGSNIEQKLILAQFPILNATEEAIELDFNAGMNELFLVGAMFASDDGNVEATYELSPAKVRISYIDRADIKDNRVSIVQVAQLEQMVNKQRSLQAVEVRYYLEPYLPDQRFEPVKSPGFAKVGYFEAMPLQLENGDSRIYAMKWNMNKPMRFAISANTPAEFRPVVAEAVLSWNKILGENKIEVVQLEDNSITAPNADLNIIQWAQWDSAGYAYADAQMDPRSGEVLHAQIFIPSAFVEGLMSGRVRLIDLIEDSKESRPVVGLKGFGSSKLCQRDLAKEFSKAFVNRTVTTPEILKLALKNYLRETIAHEVGHTLGLRHNFAGNLAANYDVAEREKMMGQFYQTGKVPEGVIATSSIMEYELFEESAWSGAGLADKNVPALAYDKMAIEHLYLGVELPKYGPLFCTDSALEVYADCKQFDAGNDLIRFNVHNQDSKLKALPARVLNKFINLTKTAKEPKRVIDIKLDAKATAASLAEERFTLMKYLKSNLKLIQVRGDLQTAQPSEEEGVQALEQNLLASQIEANGGLAKVLPEVRENLAEELKTSFAKILEDSHYVSGATWGEDYEFSDSEKASMKTAFASFADKLQSELIRLDLRALSGQPDATEDAESVPALADTELAAGLEDILMARFDKIVLSKQQDAFINVSVTPKGGGEVKAIKLPVYQYDQSLRRAAVAALAVPHKGIDFGHKAKIKAGEALENELAVIGELDTNSELNLSREGLRWLLNNRQLSNEL